MYGLVLEGGGAKGSYHAGVYKAILEEEIEIKGVTGTSIGALNGAMIVQGDFETILDLWNDISYTDIIQANEMEIENLLNTKLDLEDLKLLSKKIISVITDRGLDISPFKDMINKYIDEERVRKSPIDFGMVTINLTDRIPVEVFIEDIPQGKLGDYLLASAYVPIFKFEKLDGKIYLDGGFYDNLPFKLLQKKGYKDLILVRTHSKGFIRRPPNDDGNMIVISPSRDIGRSYICDKEQAKKNIKMGYYDALKVFRNLKGKIYYIEPNDEDYYLDYLLNLREIEIKEILNKLNIDRVPNKRTLFEHIVPKLGSIMGLREGFTYEDVLIELIEKKAMELSIEEFNIYTFDDLLDLIRNIGPIELKEVEESSLEKIIKKVD
ncbi:MAG: patatin-like phospholipase family protein, partial [Tissierella sp.]|uniref:patatin-like phospholipase family protein n=1 Tax=Tissierella sp. TaxID=41274 RepID=UPI003F9B1227